VSREREYQINIRLSYDEVRTLDKIVDKVGLNKSEYIRERILGYEPREKPPKEFYDAIKEIRAVGNNINQIARLANNTGIVDELLCRKQFDMLSEIVLELKREYLLPKKDENTL
jgi:hypothetical protein